MPLYIVLSKRSFLLKSFWHLEYSYYLCSREQISNDISDQFSAAKKLWFLCLF